MRVVALEKFEYANALRHPGDEFDTTSEKDADILILAQRVKKAEPKQTRALKAEEEPQPPKAAAPMSSDNAAPLTKPRTYKRRDMRSED